MVVFTLGLLEILFLFISEKTVFRMQRLVQGIQDFEKNKNFKRRAKKWKTQKLNKMIEEFRRNNLGVSDNIAELIQHAEAVLCSLE